MPFFMVLREYGYPPTTYWKSEKNLLSIIPSGCPNPMRAWMTIALYKFKKKASL